MLYFKATAGCGVGMFVGVSARKRAAPVALILGRVAALPPAPPVAPRMSDVEKAAGPKAVRKNDTKRKKAEGRNPRKNKWQCHCSEYQRTGRGKRTHHARCSVEQWLLGEIADPQQGDVVQGIAGTAASGKSWKYPGKFPWEEQ